MMSTEAKSFPQTRLPSAIDISLQDLCVVGLEARESDGALAGRYQKRQGTSKPHLRRNASGTARPKRGCFHGAPVLLPSNDGLARTIQRVCKSEGKNVRHFYVRIPT
jgi:hypothetical protein